MFTLILELFCLANQVLDCNDSYGMISYNFFLPFFRKISIFSRWKRHISHWPTIHWRVFTIITKMKLSIVTEVKSWNSWIRNSSTRSWWRKARIFRNCKWWLRTGVHKTGTINWFGNVFSNLKEEYMSLVNNSNPSKNLSPASSNMNDSDASRYDQNLSKTTIFKRVAHAVPFFSSVSVSRTVIFRTTQSSRRTITPIYRFRSVNKLFQIVRRINCERCDVEVIVFPKSVRSMHHCILHLSK